MPLLIAKHSVSLGNKLQKSLEWGKKKKRNKERNVVVSITSVSVGFVSLSPLHRMQVAAASRCAQSCSVLSVPAKGEWLPCHGSVYVGRGGGGGGGDEDLGCTLQQSTTSEGFERGANGSSYWPHSVGKCWKDHLPVSQAPWAVIQCHFCCLSPFRGRNVLFSTDTGDAGASSRA